MRPQHRSAPSLLPPPQLELLSSRTILSVPRSDGAGDRASERGASSIGVGRPPPPTPPTKAFTIAAFPHWGELIGPAVRPGNVHFLPWGRREEVKKGEEGKTRGSNAEHKNPDGTADPTDRADVAGPIFWRVRDPTGNAPRRGNDRSGAGPSARRHFRDSFSRFGKGVPRKEKRTRRKRGPLVGAIWLPLSTSPETQLHSSTSVFDIGFVVVRIIRLLLTFFVSFFFL